MKRKPIKIDVVGSVGDAANSSIQGAIGITVILAIFLCLLAPIFATLVEGHIRDNCKIENYYDRIQMIKSQMVIVNIILWGVCVLSWIAVIAAWIAANPSTAGN